MDKILYIGGTGSNAYQTDAVSQELSRHYNLNVVGMSFRQAQRDLPKVARMATESLVITHAAGMLVLKHITPLELIAIAPPMPLDIFRLVASKIPRALALSKSSSEIPERRNKVHQFNVHTLREHITHPRYNVGQAAKLSTFNAAQEAVTMTTNGAKVTLCFMEMGHSLVNAAKHPHVSTAKEHGVIVHEGVNGHHNEFLLYPLHVMSQLHRL
jgi:hypothetical protein